MGNNLLDIDTDHIYTYSYGRYLSNGAKAIIIFSWLVCLGVIVNALINDNFLQIFICIFIILIGILALIPSEIFQVNGHSKQYRIAIKFFSVIKGEWKSLEKVQYVSIVTKKKSIFMDRARLLPQGQDFIVEDCNLRFYIKAGYYIDIDDFNSAKKAIKIGKQIASCLNLRLLNATIRPPEFID